MHYRKIISFKNELSQTKHFIKSVAVAGVGGAPGDPEDEQRGSHALKNGEGTEGVYMINTTYIDHNYMDVLGIDMKLVSPNDQENSIIVNEALVYALGLKDPLSQTIKWGGRERSVIGVVGDIHSKSLYNPVEPKFFVPHQKRILNVFVRVNDTGAENIAENKRAWRLHFPDESFRYSFLDDRLRKQYTQEKAVTNILTYLPVLTVLISTFGMFGLSLPSAYQRKRESVSEKLWERNSKTLHCSFRKNTCCSKTWAQIFLKPSKEVNC